jgi:hypothetical protein
LHEVHFHFIATAAETKQTDAHEACLAAAILSNCLTRQGCVSTANGNTVVANALNRRENDPDQIFIVLDESSLTPDLVERFDQHCAVVLCSARPARTVHLQLGRAAACITTVDATGIAMDEGSDPVVAMLGGAARMLPFIDPDVLCASVWNNFDRDLPYAARAAMRTFDAGYIQAQQAI